MRKIIMRWVLIFAYNQLLERLKQEDDKCKASLGNTHRGEEQPERNSKSVSKQMKKGARQIEYFPHLCKALNSVLSTAIQK